MQLLLLSLLSIYLIHHIGSKIKTIICFITLKVESSRCSLLIKKNPYSLTRAKSIDFIMQTQIKEDKEKKKK